MEPCVQWFPVMSLMLNNFLNMTTGHRGVKWGRGNYLDSWILLDSYCWLFRRSISLPEEISLCWVVQVSLSFIKHWNTGEEIWFCWSNNHCMLRFALLISFQDSLIFFYNLTVGLLSWSKVFDDPQQLWCPVSYSFSKVLEPISLIFLFRCQS